VLAELAQRQLVGRRQRSGRVLQRVEDMITVDLGPVPEAQPGSLATLWGQGQHRTVLPIDEVAHCAGTIGYELMCALAPRVPVSTTA
jgi:alanine racemase